MNNMRAFNAAQARYDAMSPPEDGPTECPECGGSGHHETIDGSGMECPDCDGTGWLTADGEPFDREQAEREDDGDNAWFHDPDMGDQ